VLVVGPDREDEVVARAPDAGTRPYRIGRVSGGTGLSLR